MYRKILVAVDGSAASMKRSKSPRSRAVVSGSSTSSMGSDAEMVLRLSPVPVLVVREKPEAS